MIDYLSYYKPRSIKWALCNEDYSDLTVEQIAEVFDVDKQYIFECISKIKKDTGYEVKVQRRKMIVLTHDGVERKCYEGSLRYELIMGDHSDKTLEEIAKMYDVDKPFVARTIKEMKDKYNINVKYKNEKRITNCL